MTGRLLESARAARLSLVGFALIAIVSGLWGRHSCAQNEQPVPVIPGQPYTLHVYEDLVDIPALVLNALHGSYGGLTKAHFTIRLDSGPPFHPRHVRLQGTDPVDFAVLLDASESTNTEPVRGLDQGLASLPPQLFHEADRLSVFAFDCNLVRSIKDEIASGAAVRDGVRQALNSAALHAEKTSAAPCETHVQLWDAVGAVLMQLSQVPGRRVLLVISSGVDTGSRHTWSEVRRYADSASIAIFGLRPAVQPAGMRSGIQSGGHFIVWDREDPFSMLCAGTGGLVMTVFSTSLGPSVDRIVDLVRHRYILQFARPANGTSGQHTIDVTITDSSAIVRTSGVAFPPEDKRHRGDASIVPTDPSRAPRLGSRKILMPSQ